MTGGVYEDASFQGAEMDGALLVYDAATFELVKRLPMVKPSQGPISG